MITSLSHLKALVPRATEILLFLLIITIPFSIRHVFNVSWNYQTGAYSDFTSFSLYISDLLMLALITLSALVHRPWHLPKKWRVFALATVAWIILELFVQNRTSLPLQAYFSVRLIILIIFAAVITNIHVPREKLGWLFVILGVIQSIIATLQFYWQKSLGLYYFGESHLSPETFGVAKIVSRGAKLIRGYGTFPHSNLLAAFLLTSVAFNIYLLVKTYQVSRGKNSPRGGNMIQWKVWFLNISLIISIFGLFITFSRGGILALGLFGLILLLIHMFHVKVPYIMRIFSVSLVGLAISVFVLFPYLQTRTTVSDSSTKERQFYNQIGAEMIKNKPFFGLGPGLSVIHMKQYAKTDLKPWEIQPIHNYYLISLAEWGIGALLLLGLIVYPILVLFKRKNGQYQAILISLAGSFLGLFLIDHYFYTIWPTQILLWLVIGLVLSSTWNNPQPSTYDTASEK